MKVALVCDWLTNVGGAEKVLLALHQMYPSAPIYTSQYNPRRIKWFRDADVRVGWMRIFPCAWRRFLGVFRALYFSHLDLSDYDLVISVTGAEAKLVRTKKRAQKHERHGGHSDCSTDNAKSQAFHLSYCHVPTQYYWQMYDTYVANPGFGILNPLVRLCFKLLVGPLRKKDFEAAQRVDQFVTISEYASDLIHKYYQREAVVVHPPVETDIFSHRKNYRSATVRTLPKDFYIATSRQVTWKRLDLAVKACAETGRRLVVIGGGPEHRRLMKLARGAAQIEFLPTMGAFDLALYLSNAKGFLFPSLEPFGIAPVEALAAGCPVIAYGEGGALDYVRNGENGVLFSQQSVASLTKALARFEQLDFDRQKVAASAREFSTERFEREMRNLIDEKVI